MDSNKSSVYHSLIWAFALIVTVVAGSITIITTTHDNNQTQVQLKAIK